MCSELVSVVIPCYNPGASLAQAVMSVRQQTHKAIEIILVNDGTDTVEGNAAIRSAVPFVDHLIEQKNGGLPSARNAGFGVATGAFVIPLDCDDVLYAEYISKCLAAADAHPEAAFVYTDYRVFGLQNYIERLDDYNFYVLLDHNTLPYAALIRKKVWESVDGYDRLMRQGFEDWEFWIRLGAKGHFGYHLEQTLFGYRKHGRSLFDVAREHEREIVQYIHEKHAGLYARSSRAHIKAIWQPATCMIGHSAAPTILDCEIVDFATPAQILRTSRAQSFAISSGMAEDSTAELAALAVWCGQDCVSLPDGSVAASRKALQKCAALEDLSPEEAPHERSELLHGTVYPNPITNVYRHLRNAGLLSARVWFHHPIQSAVRLLPLRIKEEINRRTGHTVFDLSFYLQFQPDSVLLGKQVVTPLSYFPRLDSCRRRVALITPHLGPGGAESVLLNIASVLDRNRFEIFLFATQSQDKRWMEQWRQSVDHIYDLASISPPDRVPGALYSIAENWEFETLLIQNALAAYSVIPELKTRLPRLRIMDLVHAVDEKWDVVSTTRMVSHYLDVRIVISDAARVRALSAGMPEANIRLIRNGVDLTRFSPRRQTVDRRRILFAARLDPVKRPLLLVDIALELKKKRGVIDFRLIVAGDGPEAASLRHRVEQSGLAEAFEFLGHVHDLAPVLDDAELLVVTSKVEGIPIVVLEALASGKPVVASDAGAINEVVQNGVNGFLIRGCSQEKAQFARALNRLLDDAQLRKSMGAAGRRKMESEYNMEQFRNAYIKLFDAAPIQPCANGE